MRIFISICMSCCALLFGYFMHMTFTYEIMTAPTVFAFCAWLAFWFIQLMEDD